MAAEIARPGSGGRALDAAVIVAHPDDETLWAGGLILAHPGWRWFVVALCRGSDADRAPRFRRAMAALGAQGAIADLDDGPEQRPLDPAAVREAILTLLPARRYDLLLAHGPAGEYTRHLRHEEASAGAQDLWRCGEVDAGALWLFAYEDGGRAYLPRVAPKADVRLPLPESLWQRKYDIITGVYGFTPDSWEATATPREEGFRAISR